MEPELQVSKTDCFKVSMLRNVTPCFQHLHRHPTTDTCIFAVTMQPPSENTIPTISWEMGELHGDTNSLDLHQVSPTGLGSCWPTL